MPLTDAAPGYAALGLFGVKHMLNVGGVLRAAGCFNVRFVAIDTRRLPREASDTFGYPQYHPVLRGADLLAFQPHGCPAVCVELVPGAASLIDFVHPRRAYYIFGPEDGSVPATLRARCQHTVAIPVEALNLAACVNVVLYDRLAKAAREGRPL